MNRRRSFLAVVVLFFFVAAKFDNVKRVAVVSVYGPKSFHEGLKLDIAIAPFVDATEDAIIAGLKASGFEILPAPEVQTAISKRYLDRLLDAYVAEYRKNNPRAKEEEIEKAKGYFKGAGLQYNMRPTTVSKGTTYVPGTDHKFAPNLKFTIEGKPVESEKGAVAHHSAAVTALASIAAELNADAIMIVRVNPTMAETAAPALETAPSGKALGVLPALRNMKKQTKALKSGEWGGNILEMNVYGRDGRTLFEDRVIGRSSDEVGNITVTMKLVNGAGEEPSVQAMKEALDTSIRTAFRNFTGNDLATDTPGLGFEAVANAKAAAAEAAAEAAGEAPARAASAAGIYELTSMVGKPLPYTNDQGLTYEGGTLELKIDGTFFASTTLGGGKKSNYKGTYTITGDSIAFKAEGNAFVRMFAPSKAMIDGEALTVHPGDMTYKRTR